MERVKESLDDGYCDISGRKDNLHHIGMLKSEFMAHILMDLFACSSNGHRKNLSIRR